MTTRRQPPKRQVLLQDLRVRLWGLTSDCTCLVAARLCEQLTAEIWRKIQVETRDRLPWFEARETLIEAQETTRKEMAIEDKHKT